MIYCGLDISKLTIDVCILNPLQHFVIKNNHSGHRQLIKRLHAFDNVHVACEYTGIYYKSVATALFNANIAISVINPFSIASYAKLTLSRTKTDKKDAYLIADYVRVNQPSFWSPPSIELEQLQQLTRRAQQLTKMQTMEKNRLGVSSFATEQSISNTLTFLSKELKQLQLDAQKIINKSALLKHQQSLLFTIPGVGQITANILLSVLSEIDKFPSSRHLVSYYGLSPVTRQSGTSIYAQKRISKMGDTFIRKSLYMPAVSVCHSKLFKNWTAGHRERGKSYKQIYVMMMRKLLTYAYHVIKENKAFDVSIHNKY